MKTEDNKALVRRFYEAIDKGNLEAMDELRKPKSDLLCSGVAASNTCGDAWLDVIGNGAQALHNLGHVMREVYGKNSDPVGP